MKSAKLLLLLSLMGLVTLGKAQSNITIEASQLYSTFSFTDSQGTTLNSNYSGIFTGAYNLGYRYTLKNGIMFKTGLGIRKSGASMVYDNSNYTWDLQYAEFKLGMGYIMKKAKFSPYLNIAGYYAYMLRGFQTINNEDFDIKKSKSINETDFGILITPGIQLTLSEKFSSFLELNYMLGLQNLEKDENQESKNQAYGLTLGFAISL